MATAQDYIAMAQQLYAPGQQKRKYESLQDLSLNDPTGLLPIPLAAKRALVDPVTHAFRDMTSYLQSNPEGYTLNEPQNRIGAVGDMAAMLPAAGFMKMPGGLGLAANAPKAAPYYSAVGRAFEGAQMPKAQPEQWAGWIKKQPGVKPEELEWIGLDDWLKTQKGPVSKEQVSNFIRDNQVEVREVLKGENNLPPNIQAIRDKAGEPIQYLTSARMNELVKAGRMTDSDWMELQAWRRGGGQGDAPTKFSQWQMPGDRENYRELLLTLPEKEAPKSTTVEGALKRVTSQQEQNAFTGGHYDEPNVLAHVRFNDRVDTQGKKTLFIEEIQSDWHQKGRKEGYAQAHKDEIRPLKERQEEIEDAVTAQGHDATPEQQAEWARLTDQMNAIHDRERYGVPNAPFKSSWPELPLKRMIKWAADHNYDSVSWTPGKVQAERYDLSKQVRRIAWTGDGEADRIVTISPNSGNDIEFRVLPDGKVTGVGRLGGGAGQFDGKPLDEVVGKDMADKILKDRHGDLSGEGLSVGGEGMKAFYDKILPNAANKIGKKYGAKVGVSRIRNKDESAAYEELQKGQSSPVGDYDKAFPEVWTLPLTPELKAKATGEGFSLFAGGVPTFGDLMNLDQERQYRMQGGI